MAVNGRRRSGYNRRRVGARAPGVSVARATAGDDERFHVAISVVTLIESLLLALLVIRADERRERGGLLRLLGLRRRRQTTRRPVEQGGVYPRSHPFPS